MGPFTGYFEGGIRKRRRNKNKYLLSNGGPASYEDYDHTSHFYITLYRKSSQVWHLHDTTYILQQYEMISPH